MKLQVYRGTKLSEALGRLSGKSMTKASYWATDLNEAIGYADLAQRKDRYRKGSVIKADVHIPDECIYPISSANLDDLYDTSLPIYQQRIGLFRAEGGFDVMLIPPRFAHLIQHPSIIQIVDHL